MATLLLLPLSMPKGNLLETRQALILSETKESPHFVFVFASVVAFASR
jgi:hypothetical protein